MTTLSGKRCYLYLLTPPNQKSSFTRIGSNEALSVHFDVPLLGQDVHQWVVGMPGKYQTYIVTCSTIASEYKKYDSIFTETVSSLQIDAGVGGFWYRLPGGARYAIIGGLIGLGIFIISSFLRKKG